MTDPFERAVAREKLEHHERTTRHVATGFRYQFRAYVAVNAFLIVIWLLTSGPSSHPWPVWPILGWGLGVYFHWSHLREHERRGRELRESLEPE